MVLKTYSNQTSSSIYLKFFGYANYNSSFDFIIGDVDYPCYGSVYCLVSNDTIRDTGSNLLTSLP